jgi:hypothetical protein
MGAQTADSPERLPALPGLNAVALALAMIPRRRSCAEPTLFTLREDRRPAGECDAAERYSEPSLFTVLERNR